MTRQMTWVALGILGISALLASGADNRANVLRAKIPFDFTLEDQAYPAGEYVVMFPVFSGDGAAAFGANTNTLTYVLSARASSETLVAAKPSFDFRLYKYRSANGEARKAYFLFRFNVGYGILGREMARTAAERTVEREARANPQTRANGSPLSWRPEVVSLPAAR